MDFDAIMVGAGNPTGSPARPILRIVGLGVAVFGDPLSFWQEHMPAGMFLRSNWAASHISDPHKKFTLDHFRADSGKQFAFPIPLERFVEYGLWFQQNAVPEVQRRQVIAVKKKRQRI